MEDSFLSLDAEQINTLVEKLQKDLSKAYKAFNSPNVEGCLDIAATIKKEVADFSPYCPLITALRTKGMKYLMNVVLIYILILTLHYLMYLD